ncbi:hypothetical protein EON65_46590 [archaeon]|nr:MAG: hypothetical protein EON65_46590 [archaeon]
MTKCYFSCSQLFTSFFLPHDHITHVAVGIDLGTTFSVIGANINGEVVVFSDRQGRRIFPSVVSYLDNGGM